MPNPFSPHGGSISEGAISNGTLRTQDLLRTFADEIERIHPFNTSAFVAECREAADALDAETLTEHDAALVLSEAFSRLEDYAPDDMYFGTLEGDGACFGFWAFHENEWLA